jgi:hypothetical protein
MVGRERLLGPPGEGANTSGGWHGCVKLLEEEKEGQKAHRGGAGTGTGTKSSPEAAMAAGLALGCARWGNEKERGPGLACSQVKGEEGGPIGVAHSRAGGPGRQRHGRDGGGRQSGGALVREQGRGGIDKRTGPEGGA